ncbi:CDP-glucose 4,6-dehydratase [Methanosphaerula palustris E1-9c]|uniref:CDP-glucose 4,6-dehydratase n=2 Tax=Methanosphaerula palustris TaxID=475088 RepID=B8GDY6_METPE|nr:CDP-glucose 4,6-dehydratase [Methanosphaerula palustris E1-9c]
MSISDKLAETYRGRTVLITGHTGFKGGWLALWLESLGAHVIGYSLDPPTDPSFFQETELSRRITDIRGDILDQTKLDRVINEYRPDFVFHLAAQPLVRASYQSPRETFNVNVMGTVNVLESIRVSQHPTVCVCITSDKCYENKEWDYAYRENDPIGGHDPYSASKGAAEIVIASYRKSFFEPDGSQPLCALSSARAGNIIGGGDWADDRIVPDCVRSLVNGETMLLRNPTAVRPWQFVLDPLFGYLLLAQRMKEYPGEYSGAWNFGPYYSNNVDVQTLTGKIFREWGIGRWENMPQQNNLHEACFLKLDIAKSMTRLGWKPVYSIDDAIHKTIEWYMADFSRAEEMYNFSLDQIAMYMHDADNVE